jgi:predicted regulator of Ras-like GTPase activity (Roadblock/LC7/MglB family)
MTYVIFYLKNTIGKGILYIINILNSYYYVIVSISDEYLFLLDVLYEGIDGIRSTAIVSIEGLIVHSILEEEISDLKIVGMIATFFSIVERVLIELKSGKLDLCILQGDIGNSVVIQAGSDLILAVWFDIDA